MNSSVKKVLRDPIGAVRRTVDKLVVGPLRYRKGRSYDAQAYWGNRFSRYGSSLRGPGDEGLSETDNDRDYAVAGDTFRSFCEKNRLDFAAGKTLEIGPGTGFYTRIMVGKGATLTGFDITDVLFDELRAELPSVELRQGDVSHDAIEGSYEIAVMIDVIEHIVTEEAFRGAMGNIAKAVTDDGVFILGPVLERHGRHLYYVHFWTEEDARAALPGWNVVDAVPFRSGRLLLLRRGA
ncbi:MAG TPA: class I SAM-dependent methyltransferase [Acidimicrobiia bacterium]